MKLTHKSILTPILIGAVILGIIFPVLWFLYALIWWEFSNIPK